MTRAAIYLRISRDREGLGLGVERQEQQCRALAEKLGCIVTAVYSDNDIGASRHSRKVRPDYRKMLDAAKAGEFSVIIAATQKRLTRLPREYEDLIDLFDEAGTTYEFVKSPKYDLGTAGGRRRARQDAAESAEESDEISERVRDKLDQRKAAGLPHGGQRAYGWEVDRMTIRQCRPHSDEDGQERKPCCEAGVIRWGAQQTLGGISIRSQFRELNELGMMASRGGPWSHGSYRDVLINPRHAGLMPDGSPASWPGIITPAEHRALARFMNDPARVRTPGRAGKTHLLSGVPCDVCGGPVRVTNSKGVPSYRCQLKSCCTRSRALVDQFVLGVIAEVLRRPSTARLLDGDATETARALRLAAEARAEDLRHRIDEAAREGAELGMSLREVAAHNAPLREQLAIAEKEAEPPTNAAGAFGDIAGASDRGAAFLAAGVERQRAVIDLLAEVRIGRGPKGPIFRPDGILITPH